MTKGKAFWLSFALTLAVLTPLYLGTILLRAARPSRAVDTPQSGVWIAQPIAQDAKTIFVMTGSETAKNPSSFALVRLDALKNEIAAAVLPPETVVLVGGTPQTLAEAVADAGPSQGVAALAETLEIPIDNYLFCTPQVLQAVAQPLGSIQLRLGQLAGKEVLRALELDVSGGETQTLTPALAAQVLASDSVPAAAACRLRAQIYTEFLRVGTGSLADSVPAAVRKNTAKMATDLTATDLYAYERIFKFLDRQEPQVTAAVPEGMYTGGRYELGEGAAVFAAEHLGARAGLSADDAEKEMPDSMGQNVSGNAVQSEEADAPHSEAAHESKKENSARKTE